MKKIVFIILMLAGCRANDQPNICGVYTRSFMQEYASGNDTLVISELNSANAIYKIEHHTSYIPVLNGLRQTPKSISETWTAFYYTETKQFVDQRKGKMFSFSPKYDCLFLGISKYDKIK